MNRTKSMIYKPSIESDELTLYAENTRELYHRMIQPLIKSLSRKLRAGKYDADKAIDAWYYVASEAAKMYTKEFASSNPFSVTDRFTAACELAERYREFLED